MTVESNLKSAALTLARSPAWKTPALTALTKGVGITGGLGDQAIGLLRGIADAAYAKNHPVVVPPPVVTPPAGTHVYPAGTFPSPGTFPDGAIVVGAGIGKTILTGHVEFGSRQTYHDLTIAAPGASAVHNKNGATGTLFNRVRFRGGGGSAYTSVVDLGSPASCDHVTFKACEVERNLGSDPSFANGFNDVTIWVGHGWQVDDILWDGCKIGVHNGVAEGSPRMSVECYVNDDAPRAYSNIVFRDTLIFGGDAETLDFSDRGEARATGIVVEGCDLRGGGRSRVKWGVTLNLECPLGAVIRNNTIGHYWGPALQMTNRGQAFGAPFASILSNVIDLTGGEATTNGNAPIQLWGDNNQFVGNKVLGHKWASALMWLRECHGNVITGNTLDTDSAPFIEMDGSSGNTLAPNTVI